jgi:hypothetical protein
MLYRIGRLQLARKIKLRKSPKRKSTTGNLTMDNNIEQKIPERPTQADLPQYASNSTAMDEDLNRDDTLLASLGYKAELKREFTALEVFGLAFSIIGLLPSIASTLVYSMPNGGPVGMVVLRYSD